MGQDGGILAFNRGLSDVKKKGRRITLLEILLMEE